MPFSKNYNDIYKLGIKEAAKECDVKAERLDEQMFNEGMLERIYHQIDMADFIIADLSGRNANVFYELGYAHAKEKICILLTKDSLDIPFDLKHKRHVVYGDSITYLKDELIKNIQWAKKEVKAKEEITISVIPKQPTGVLKLSKQSAKASITFAFDLHNKTNKISPEISAIYLYTGNQWEIIHDSKECAYSDSDIDIFKYRYFISPPTLKIGRKGWTQVKVKANRTIATTWKDGDIKSEYKVAGRGILRLETADGNIDHDFSFDLTLKNELNFL